MGESLEVYKAISNVTKALSKDGISKDRSNSQQGYKFRGIDDVYNAISPMLAEHGLVIMPYVLSREVQERTNKGGTLLFYVLLQVRYDFICVNDGSKHEVIVYGEAMDSGDKATNKAMSAAYKYACLQAFAIPTEGDNDADGTTHEIKGETATARNKRYNKLKAELMECDDPASFWHENKDDINEFKTTLGQEYYDQLVKVAADRKRALAEKEAMQAGMPQGFNEVR